MSAAPSLPAPAPVARELWSHEFLEALALAYYTEMAHRLRRNPALAAGARENLRRWLAGGGYAESQVRALREWEPLLEPQRLADLLRVMTDDGEEAVRMRQSGPFAGVLTAQERKALKEELKAKWCHGTL